MKFQMSTCSGTFATDHVSVAAELVAPQTALFGLACCIRYRVSALSVANLNTNLLQTIPGKIR